MIEVEDKIWWIMDYGKIFECIFEGEDVKFIIMYKYYSDIVYFMMQKQKVIYSIDGGNIFYSFEVLILVDEGLFFSFYFENKDWFIWVGK